MNQKPPRTVLKSLAVGLLLGAALAAVCVAGILVLTTLADLLLLLLFSFGMGGKVGVFGMLAWLVGLGVGLVLILGIVALAVRWALRRFARWHKDGWTWAAMGVGIAGAIALAFLFSPYWLKDTTTRLVTGESIANRASLPASEPEIRHMQTVVRPAADAGDALAQFELGMAQLHGAAGEKRDRETGTRWIRQAAAQPQGIEARLLLAVEQIAEPIPEIGRMRTSSDVDKKVEALLALRSTLPEQWQPVMLATVGILQQSSYRKDTPEDQAIRDRMIKIGAGGSRAFTVYAAQLEETTASSHEMRKEYAEADIAWQRALQGYAQAGAVFETERLQREMLPKRLRSLSVPAVDDNLLKPDAALSQRLWNFALTVDREQVHERTAGGDQELAKSAALLALEYSPNPAEIASVHPARVWSGDTWAYSRWLLALRHARGDCMAALELSEATKSWRRPGDQQPWTLLNYAWARAWAESAEQCARTDEERRQVREPLDHLIALSHYQGAAPGELENARAGVASMIAQLR